MAKKKRTSKKTAKKTAKKVAKKTKSSGKTGTRSGASSTSKTHPPTKRGSSKKLTKKTAKKASKKPKRASGAGPRHVSTGRGPGPREIGEDLVKLFNQGKFAEVERKWWSPKIESVEGIGMSWSGRKAVESKNSEWMEQHVIHGSSAEGPYVGATGFSVKFRMDVEVRETGERMVMDEIGVYTVLNGKIVREEFMYGAS